MEKNKSKNIVSILMVVALLFLCVGITYTALTYMKSSEDNSINIGRISMSYSEPSNALELINALPMSDEEGLAQTNYFEFTVSSNASTNANDDIGVTIPYEINISDITIDTDKTILPKDKIKVAITRVVDGKEETIMVPTVISEMSTSVLREAASKVYETKDVYKNNNGTITTRYRLRAWIDKDFELDNTLTYQYKFRVNVNSNTTPLSILKVDKIMLEVWEANTIAMSNSKDSVIRLANEEDGRWVEVLDEKTLTKDDRIRITFIYNNNIKGTAPTLSLKFGESVATGKISNGAILDNKLSYEYTITKEDSGKLNINELVGGSIKDETGNMPAVLTKQEKESLKANAETIPTFGETLAKSVVTSGDGLYVTTETNSGKPSFYYKGVVTNNYVKLPEKNGYTTTNALYRIVRINEDGSIRLIRQDDITYNAHFSSNRYYFNRNNSNNYKYMYYSESNVEKGAMKAINDWYLYVIDGTILDSKIVENDFCEQAKVKRLSSYTSGETTMMASSKDYKPSLKCETDGNGKGILSMKVGLITADELIMAGIPIIYTGMSSTEYNTRSYIINSGMGCWTMSPAGFKSDKNYSEVWYNNSAGVVVSVDANSGASTLRPVFSLSSDIEMTGNGTESDPFVPILIDRQF